MLIEYDFTLEHINLSTCHDLSGEPLGQNLLCSRGASFCLLRKIPARKITSRCPTFCLRSHILGESEIKRGARARYTHAWKYRRGCVWRRAARGLELRPLFILRCGKVLPFGAKFGAHAARVQNRAPAGWANGRLVLGLHVQGNYGRVPCMHAAMPPTSRPDRRIVAAKSED
jgi:hypothetical protein